MFVGTACMRQIAVNCAFLGIFICVLSAFNWFRVGLFEDWYSGSDLCVLHFIYEF